jgi:hypothetical protein
MARWHGDNYQSRIFWENAFNLLDCRIPASSRSPSRRTAQRRSTTLSSSMIRRLRGPDPERVLRRVPSGQMARTETGGRFGLRGFTSRPDFIGAQTVLDAAAPSAGARDRPRARTAHFTFLTTYRIKDGDPLADLVSGHDKTLLIERLFDGTTDRSRMGKVRKCWRDHLKLATDDELKRGRDGWPARASTATAPSKSCAPQINSQGAGRRRHGLQRHRLRLPLRRIGPPAEDTPAQRAERARPSCSICRDEGLLAERTQLSLINFLPVAIRSFLGPAADVSSERLLLTNTLLLTDEFRQRYLAGWIASGSGTSARSVEAFLRDCGAQVAAAAADPRRARVNRIPRGRGPRREVRCSAVELVQKGRVGARVWRPDDGSAGVAFTVARHEIGAGPAIAVAISVAQPTEAQVRQYVAREVPEAGRLLTFSMPDGTGHQKVTGGAHAAALAEQIATVLRQEKEADPDAVVHIFAAVPNTLLFYLGQHHQSIAPCIVYEFDFDRGGNKSYHPSFIID